MYEAIEEELAMTKAEVNSLQTRLEVKDGEIVNHCADLTRAKSEKNQLNEVSVRRDRHHGNTALTARFGPSCTRML